VSYVAGDQRDRKGTARSAGKQRRAFSQCIDPWSMTPAESSVPNKRATKMAAGQGQAQRQGQSTKGWELNRH